MLGPLPDSLGERIRRNHSEQSAIEQFWNVAKQSLEQTSSYLKSGDAIEAVRMFDMGMTISDMGRLVEAYARSNASMGRAWSAGITNVGEYERQYAVERKGLKERSRLKVRIVYSSYSALIQTIYLTNLIHLTSWERNPTATMKYKRYTTQHLMLGLAALIPSVVLV